MNLFGLVKMLYAMPAGKLGKIFVKYGQPVNFNEYIAKNQSKTFKNITYELTREFTLF